MKIVLEQYFKAFLIYLTVGIIASLAIDVVNGDPFELEQTILFSIFFGAIMSIILVSIEISFFDKKISEIQKEDFNSKKSKTFESNASLSEIRHLLQATTDLKLTSESESTIEFKTKMSLDSLGNRFRIKSTGNNQFLIEGKPRFSSSFGDSQSTIKNMGKIIAMISQIT